MDARSSACCPSANIVRHIATDGAAAVHEPVRSLMTVEVLTCRANDRTEEVMGADDRASGPAPAGGRRRGRPVRHHQHRRRREVAGG